jgi:hypothetical protein
MLVMAANRLKQFFMSGAFGTATTVARKQLLGNNHSEMDDDVGIPPEKGKYEHPLVDR